MSSVTPKLVVFSMNIEGQEGIADTLGDEAGACARACGRLLLW
jgi:hypothetical protein